MEVDMSAGYSKQDLLSFLDYLSNKGLMNKDTVSSRRAAVNTLLSILSDDEAANLKGLDLDTLLQRFVNLKGSGFKPESVRVYKSRLGAVLADFERYKRDPLNYKPNHTARERAQRPQNGDTHKETPKRAAIPLSGTAGFGTASVNDDEIQAIEFPIPIRKGVIVRVAGIPSDLTPEEAQKIGNVILALSGSQETD
jgi:hypothetical protein